MRDGRTVVEEDFGDLNMRMSQREREDCHISGPYLVLDEERQSVAPVFNRRVISFNGRRTVVVSVPVDALRYKSVHIHEN